MGISDLGFQILNIGKQLQALKPQFLNLKLLRRTGQAPEILRNILLPHTSRSRHTKNLLTTTHIHKSIFANLDLICFASNC
jgi:hypothetical protein